MQQCRLQPSQTEFVGPQRAGQRVGLQRLHVLRPPDDDSRLRAAQQFIATETNHRRSRRETLLHHRLVHQSELSRVEQRAAPQVIHHRQATLSTQRDQVSQPRLGGKAHNAEIGMVRPQDQSHVLVLFQRRRVVAQVSAVGRADLDQPRTTLRHYIRHAEAAADLHQLSPRDDHTPVLRQPGQRQEHRPGVVVDHQCRLRPGQFTQQPLGVHSAVTAPPRPQVILQRGVAPPHRLHRRPCGGRERGSSQVGVDDDAGTVDDRAQRRNQPLSQKDACPCHQRCDARHIRPGPHLIAHHVERLTQRVHSLAVAVCSDQFPHGLLAEQPVHAGELAQFLAGHPCHPTRWRTSVPFPQALRP